VGPTGAGKSTIAKLITRFYDPLAGRVLIDGHDVREVTFGSLRHQLGVVPRSRSSSRDDRREHRLRRAHATRDDILDACRAVGIDASSTRSLRSRHAVPRTGRHAVVRGAPADRAGAAFLAQPRVLILDEATSSLDLGTEAMVERALDVLLEGRTAILIATA